MHPVHSVAQCERIMQTGWRNRSVGCTLMNKDSSRSHAVFTISIEICAVGTWSRAGGGGPTARAGSPPLAAGTRHLPGALRQWAGAGALSGPPLPPL